MRGEKLFLSGSIERGRKRAAVGPGLAGQHGRHGGEARRDIQVGEVPELLVERA